MQTQLTEATYRHFRRIMEARGKKFSDALLATIHALCAEITAVSNGKQIGRVCWGINTGGGKTTVALALMLALEELKLTHIGVIVCQNRVASLGELYDDLIESGVPEEKITFIFSGKREHWTSSTHEPEDANQYTLLTHANALDKQRLQDFASWKGQPRIVLWDESLLTRTAVSLGLRQLHTTVSDLEYLVRYSRHFDLEPLAIYLRECHELAEKKLEFVRFEDYDSHRIKFPSRTNTELKAMRTALAKVHRPPKHATTFLNLSRESAVVVRVGTGGVITYVDAVPEGVALNMFILDASWLCREVLSLDKTLRSAEDLVRVKRIIREYKLEKGLASLKRYDRVTVRQVLTTGGRKGIVNADLAPYRSPKVLPMVVDEVIKAAEAGIPVLVYHYLAREGEPDARAALVAELVEQGHRKLLDEKTADGRDVLCFEHHGNETGFNRYNHVGLVILWGVLHDDDTVTASKLVAGHDNLDAYVSATHIDRLHRSERRHRVFQAISRGRMRNPAIDDPEQATEMRVVIFDSDETMAEKIDDAMPGLQWTMELGPGRRSGVQAAGCNVLAEELAERSEPWKTGEAKQWTASALNREKIPTRTWKTLRDAACEQTGWTVKGSGPVAHLVPPPCPF